MHLRGTSLSVPCVVQTLKAVHYMDNKLWDKIEYSLSGFNGSNNCDKSSPETFYESYLNRQQELLNDRHFKLSNHTSHPSKRLKEYMDLEFRIKYVKENKQRVLDFISERFFGEF